VFRLSGDLVHLASFAVLFLKMRAVRSVDGLSQKTQELYLLVFVARYLDLFSFAKVDFLHVYNFLFKVIYICASATIVYYFRFKNPWKSTYKASEDSFLHWKFAVAPCAVLALLVHSELTVLEVLWTFSIYLEAIAIMPQLILMQRYGNVENLTANYVFCLGAYRALYVLNWIDRYLTDTNYHTSKTTYIVWVSGFVQTALYVDFFYYYCQHKWYGKGGALSLPK
jgi:ER lumen protein retaining receptor